MSCPDGFTPTLGKGGHGHILSVANAATNPPTDASYAVISADGDTYTYFSGEGFQEKTNANCTLCKKGEAPAPVLAELAAPGAVNPFPKKGVIWTYLCGTRLQDGTKAPASMNIDNDLTLSNSLVKLITQQKVNYLCLGFLKVNLDGGLEWNIDSGCRNDYDALKEQLKILHDKYRVCITASIGGELSGDMYKSLTNPTKALTTFEKLRDDQPYLDGIDFDIEAQQGSDYPTLGEYINAAAKVFKSAGYVVTTAATPAQISPGCGGNKSGWGTSQQALINLDMTYMDGIMLQWYEGGSENGNSGQSPLSAQGIVNFYIALSGDSKLKGYIKDDNDNGNNPPIEGACESVPGQAAGKWATCNGKCYMFDPGKIAIGFQTYGGSTNPKCGQNDQWNSGASTQNILQDAIKLLQTHNIPFLGVSSWAIYNVFCASPRYINIFPSVFDLMNK